VWVRHGEQLRIVDVEGGQVGDLFAFAAADPGEYLSASHTRTSTSRLFPRVGEQFMTNRRRPILTLVADTSPGVHDMLIAACDPERYRMLGAPGHASCADNVHHALAQIGLATDAVPQPVNVFMNIPVGTEGDLSWLPAVSRPGDAVTFTAGDGLRGGSLGVPDGSQCDQWPAADFACHRYHVTESCCSRRDLST